jgi:methylmalonyl-CoA mutase
LTWNEKSNKYKKPCLLFKVRDRRNKMATHTESLSFSNENCLAKYQAWGDIYYVGVYRKMFLENFTAGLYPFKREGEDPRMFGEGGQKETNVSITCAGLPAKRLSTAFDSVTLYGNDPHIRR